MTGAIQRKDAKNAEFRKGNSATLSDLCAFAFIYGAAE